ncbi:2-dehydropantoate 2-reductase [Halalkalibacter hemicellulosilyticus]|uniref:2-dehydropantoate 2-reductase n=1 Tax=Halalkalibacter hemicellulosilyticusJCM 9152 TaxID=1236971 RepID=W4QCN0_9BACI|nr:2-dehydropantoate 2-reductase [Halalkalibacter hemicellulosilyticus]GAE29139.1 2-dehydropantoate 2-reductase [Halalkalibacter hemicellulosilyticusJCM 9152]
MNVTIIGSGAIGMLLSYYFVEKGQTITLVVRRDEQLKQLQNEGLQITRYDQTHHNVKVKTMTFDHFMSSNALIDLAVIAVKAYDWPTVDKSLQKRMSTIKSILFLQNGMEHISYLSQYTCSEVAVGVVEHGAKRLNDFTVVHTGASAIKWGYVKYGEQKIMRTILEEIASLHFEEVSNWYEALMRKTVVNVCINPLTALFQVENGELLANEHLTTIMKHLFDEVVEVFELIDHFKVWSYVTNICERTKYNQSSMYVDLQQGRKSEIEAIVGSVQRMGKEKGINTPYLNMMFDAIKAMEWQKGVR